MTLDVLPVLSNRILFTQVFLGCTCVTLSVPCLWDTAMKLKRLEVFDISAEVFTDGQTMSLFLAREKSKEPS